MERIFPILILSFMTLDSMNNYLPYYILFDDAEEKLRLNENANFPGNDYE